MDGVLAIRDPIVEKMQNAGFVIAGGAWGCAAWLEIEPDLNVALVNEQTLSIPREGESCTVDVFRGPFDPDWVPADGEAPSDREYASLDFPTLHSALLFIRELAHMHRVEAEAVYRAVSDIASRDLNIPVLAVRNRDRLDFHEVYIGSVWSALTAAYRAGQRSVS